MNTLYELREYFSSINEKKGIAKQFSDKNASFAYITFKQENWKTPYSEIQRTYKVRSDNKYFLCGCGSSLYSECLDGIDHAVRLDWYNWEVEKITFEPNPDMLLKSLQNSLTLVSQDVTVKEAIERTLVLYFDADYQDHISVDLEEGIKSCNGKFSKILEFLSELAKGVK